MAVIRLPVLNLLNKENDINALEAEEAPDKTTFKT